MAPNSLNNEAARRDRNAMIEVAAKYRKTNATY
jgi:hypothetical protein